MKKWLFLLLATALLTGCGSFGEVTTTPQEKAERIEERADSLKSIYNDLKSGTADDRIRDVAENGSGFKQDLAVEYLEWSEWCDYGLGYIIAKQEGRLDEYIAEHGYVRGDGSVSSNLPNLSLKEVLGANTSSSGSHAVESSITSSPGATAEVPNDRIVYPGDTPFEVAFNERRLLQVKLDYIVDGDTINVSVDGAEARVRLTGIDTDESVASDEYLDQKSQYTGKKEENGESGKAASKHTKELLSGKSTLWLEFDEELYDPYGRVLAYVWMDPDISELDNMLQVRILDDGYARTLSLKPNTKYAKTFDALVDDGK